MNSFDPSLIALEPFINKFTLGIIKSIRGEKFPQGEIQVIHSDLVPRVSERVMLASLGGGVVPRAAPTQAPRVMPVPKVVRPRAAPVRVQPPGRVASAFSSGSSEGYGKITLLLNDPSVSTIECKGAGKAITVIRAGQVQITRIVLNERGVHEVLDKISEASHIPLVEGVFRAAAENFSINAVISEVIGSRFVIKKNTAYSLLER